MSVCHLEGFESLTEVLQSDERARPGMILIGSPSCRPFLDMQSRIEVLAEAMPQFAFYDFTVDHGERRVRNRQLAQLIAQWQINPVLSQVLLPSTGKPQTISTDKEKIIKKALRELY